MSGHRRLVRALEADLPVPVWPEGVGEAALVQRDIPAIHNLLERAYARGGGSVEPLERWWPAVAADTEYDPELCVVAKAADGGVIGFALVWSGGFIKDLVVDPRWQGQGIGTALLREVFQRLKARGHKNVALKVMADNPSGAERLYRQLGFVDG